MEGSSAYRPGDRGQAETRHKAFPATRPALDPTDNRPAAPRSAPSTAVAICGGGAPVLAGTEAARADLDELADLLVATRVS